VAVVNLQFTNPVAYRLDLPEIAKSHTVKPGAYPVHGHLVMERVQPPQKRGFTAVVKVVFKAVRRFNHGIL
jgi:hypothetical protein